VETAANKPHFLMDGKKDRIGWIFRLWCDALEAIPFSGPKPY
jgi:hypothetical protein